MLELNFVDNIAVDAVVRLMKYEIEENFDDMRVRSLVDDSESAFDVENQIESPPREIIAQRKALRKAHFTKCEIANFGT